MVYRDTVEGIVREYRWCSLHFQILVVAFLTLPPSAQKQEVVERWGPIGFQGDWMAYIAPVPGKDHECEWRSVMKHGSRCSESVARAIFPDIELKYRG